MCRAVSVQHREKQHYLGQRFKFYKRFNVVMTVCERFCRDVHGTLHFRVFLVIIIISSYSNFPRSRFILSILFSISWVICFILVVCFIKKKQVYRANVKITWSHYGVLCVRGGKGLSISKVNRCLVQARSHGRGGVVTCSPPLPHKKNPRSVEPF